MRHGESVSVAKCAAFPGGPNGLPARAAASPHQERSCWEEQAVGELKELPVSAPHGLEGKRAHDDENERGSRAETRPLGVAVAQNRRPVFADRRPAVRDAARDEEAGVPAVPADAALEGGAENHHPEGITRYRKERHCKREGVNPPECVGDVAKGDEINDGGVQHGADGAAVASHLEWQGWTGGERHRFRSIRARL